MRYLRHKTDGTIYGWNEILAKDPLCEEVTEAEAFPDAATKAAKPAKPKREPAPVADDSALREDASRGLP